MIIKDEVHEETSKMSLTCVMSMPLIQRRNKFGKVTMFLSNIQIFMGLNFQNIGVTIPKIPLLNFLTLKDSGHIHHGC